MPIELQVVTSCVAVVGAILGLINTWHNLSKDDLRLKIVPANCLLFRMGVKNEWTLSIDVINLSSFPVTVEEVGLRLRSGDKLVIPATPTTNGKGLPQRLEPREALTIMFDSSISANPKLADVRKAYARCQCGSLRYGSGPALKQLINNAKSKSQRTSG